MADDKLEEMTRQFHEAYERLAPEFGYKTRKESAVDWEDVPAANKNLMLAVVKSVIGPVIETLRQEREREDKEAFEAGRYIGSLMKQIASLELVRKALEWYADEDNWQQDKQAHPLDIDMIPAHYDKGVRARNESARHEREWPKEP